MTAEVREETNQIRDVNVRWAHVIVEGHTVEQVLSFDVPIPFETGKSMIWQAAGNRRGFRQYPSSAASPGPCWTT